MPPRKADGIAAALVLEDLYLCVGPAIIDAVALDPDAVPVE